MYTKEEILAEAQLLADRLVQMEEVLFYQQAEAKVNGNQKIEQLINQIKYLQKQAVNLEHYGKPGALEKTEKQLAKLNNELENMPLVRQFQAAQVEVNGLLQLVTETVADGIARGMEE